MKTRLAAVLILSVVPITSVEASVPAPLTDVELGYIGAVRSSDGEVQENRPYLIVKGDQTLYSGSDGADQVSFHLVGRGFLSNEGDEVSPRTLSVAWDHRSFKIEVGFQEISWGETFGFFIADIVNPRDYRDPLFNDPSWYHVPVFAVNAQYFLGPATFQMVATPIAAQPIIPNPGAAFDPFPPALDSLSRQVHDQNSAEFGGKLSYLFQSGLDLGAIYYHHWNRVPVFQLDLLPSGPVLADIESQVDSLGLTASQSVGDFVFRADSIMNMNNPIQSPTFTQTELENDWQSIVGADYTSANNLVLGLQYHLQVRSPQALEQADLAHWMSARVSDKFFSEKIIPELFVFRGINEREFWFQGKLGWNATSSLNLSVRYDLVRSSAPLNEGALATLDHQDRFLVWASYHL